MVTPGWKSPHTPVRAEIPLAVDDPVRKPRLNKWAILACLVSLLASDDCRAAETSDSHCLSVIFGEELHSDIKGTRALSAKMATSQRYEFLLNRVLPENDDHAINVEIDFAPACPSPVTARLLNLPSALNDQTSRESNSRLTNGADLISPAIDLVSAARELGRLDELRDRVIARRPSDPDGEQARLSMLALIEMAAGDLESAHEAIDDLHVSIAGSPVTQAERGSVAAVIWAGIRYPEMVEAARDLTFLAYEQARKQLGPRSERWHRQLYSMKHDLQRRIETRSKNSALGSRQGSALRNWIPVSRMTAETCGKGYPLAGWETANGSATHVTCHDHDYLTYAVPLAGDFEVEADLTTFGYRDIQLAAGSFWAGPGYDHAGLLNGNFHSDHSTLRLNPKLTRMLDWMRVRIVVKDGIRITFINGRNVFSRPHPAGSDPWIAIHSPWYTNGSVRDLRVKSDGKVPEEINLAGTPDLPGWLPYFDESAGHDDANWREHSQDGSTFLQGRRQWGMNGSLFESLLRYHRPVAEDGVINYDYFYSPNQIDVHPSLGRLAFLIEPSGVKVHWITDGRFESTSLDPANAIDEPANRRGPAALPLKPGDWNNIQLEIDGDIAKLSLNGQLIYERTLEPTNQRTFGLFHYADRSEARVRNIRWRGDWPRTLPADRDQELADRSIDDIDDHRETLSAQFSHDFSEGFPRSDFDTLNSGGELQIEEVFDGFRVTRPGGKGWPNTSLVPKLKVHGDFDITAEFADFTSKLDDGGGANLQLFVELHDEQHTECRLSRSRTKKSEDSDEHLAQAAFFTGPSDRRGYDFFASPAEESTSGRIRLARRGDQLHFLYAEDDSPFFRLLASRPVSTSSSRSYGVRLMLETPRGGTSSVTWKNLDVRAESLTGEALAPSYSLADLNRQRSRLPVLLDHDFTKSESLKPFLIWGTDGEFTPETEGVKITVPGTDEWLAAGLAPKLELTGDFDVSLNLEVLQVDKAAENQETSIYLETELDDERKTAVEMKFVVSSTGVRSASMQLRQQSDGKTDHRVLGSREVEDVSQLRLARRGSIVYLIFQSSPDGRPQIVTTAEIGRDPVPATFLRALIHTGGAGRETVVRFKSLTIHSQTGSTSG